MGALLFVFSFTTSSLMPILFLLTASFLGGVVASLFQHGPEPELLLPEQERQEKTRVVKGLVFALVIISIPFWLFSFFVEAWGGLPARVTEAHPKASPDGAYVAVIHNVDPNVNDYSDVIIRPKRTFLDLFTGFSASTRLDGVDKIEWLDRRTLRVSGDFHPHAEMWHDVHIVYKDTADPEERRERDALAQISEGQ